MLLLPRTYLVPLIICRWLHCGRLCTVGHAFSSTITVHVQLTRKNVLHALRANEHICNIGIKDGILTSLEGVRRGHGTTSEAAASDRCRNYWH